MKTLDAILETAMSREDIVSEFIDDKTSLVDGFISDLEYEKIKAELAEEEDPDATLADGHEDTPDEEPLPNEELLDIQTEGVEDDMDEYENIDISNVEPIDVLPIDGPEMLLVDQAADELEAAEDDLLLGGTRELGIADPLMTDMSKELSTLLVDGEEYVPAGVADENQ